MVAGCPKCKARYRVDAERIGPDGAKLRCTRCSAVFLVRAAPNAPAPVKAASRPTTDRIESPPFVREPEPEVDPSRLVLVADPNEARGKTTAEAIRSWGFTPLLVHDGVEAMLAIQRKLPAAVVLDAALPKMFGFQVCEVVKRNPSLCNTRVVLVGAIHHQDRYRRDPSELYGADVYIESPDLPDGLRALLGDVGISLAEASASATISSIPEMERKITPAVESRPAPPPRAVPKPVAAPAVVPTLENPERTAERERAQRLARIAVSEMVLYQPEQFDRAARNGNLERALELEINEARALLRQRIGEEVRAETDFIIDELKRVAKERGRQG